MRSLTARHVPRPRLVQECEHAPVVLVEAPGGFGKSVLVTELREHLDLAAVEAVLDERGSALGAIRHAARRAGLSDVAVALEGEALPAALAEALTRQPAPVLLVVDEVQRADAGTVALLRTLAATLPPGHRLVLVGRRLDAGLLILREEVGARRIDAEALSFTREEVGVHAGEDARAATIHAATAGWPAACALAAARLERSPQARLPAAGLASLIDDLLGSESADLAVLGHLPLLSDEVAAACAGPGALERARVAGLPLRARDAGWWEMPDPVRDVLAARGPLPIASARAVAARYAHAGELRAGARLLAGDADGMATLLGQPRWTALSEFELNELRALLDGLPDDALRRDPRALISAARLAEASADVEVRGRLLERALTVLDPGPLRREADAEMAAVQATVEPERDVGETAAALLAALPPEETVARARTLLAIARVDAWRGDPLSMRRAETGLEQVAALCRLASEPEWEASALLALGYRVCFSGGDLDRAVDHLTAALALVPGAARPRASLATFLATVVAYVGRLDEAEGTLREAEAIARAIGDHRAQAYVAWTWAQLASLRGDRATTVHRIRFAERHFGDWYDHPTGTEFLADAAVALARVGDEALARAYAERAAEHAAGQGWPEIALRATGTVEARFGDPAIAESDLVAFAASPESGVRDEWHLLLLRAHAASRAGDSRAAELTAEAYAAAAALGHPDLPRIHEPDLVAGSAGTSAPGFAIRVLGDFHVSANGRAAPPPPGRPAILAKLLAVRREVVAVEESIEILWPDVPLETGRARLRNLLNRLRAACGALVERSEDGLRLSAHASVDATRFEADARAALAAPEEVRAGLARAALAVYAGELLPEDRYADWATAPRERLRRTQLELLDLLADDAVDRGDVDEAIRLLERGTEAEPLDEVRLLRAAELLLFQGRRGSARSLVDRAVALRADLGVAPTRQLERLAEAVGRPLDGGRSASPP